PAPREGPRIGGVHGPGQRGPDSRPIRERRFARNPTSASKWRVTRGSTALPLRTQIGRANPTYKARAPPNRINASPQPAWSSNCIAVHSRDARSLQAERWPIENTVIKSAASRPLGGQHEKHDPGPGP